jgi:hypothetical protein
MNKKDVTLYYNVKVHIKNFPSKCHFQMISSLFKNLLSNKKTLVLFFKSDFEYFMLIK